MIATKTNLKRWAKSARNLLKDPLPRNRVLHFERIRLEGDAVTFDYRINQRSYWIRLLLPPLLLSAIRRDQSQPVLQSLMTIGVALSARFFKISDLAALHISCAPVDAQTQAFFESYFLHGLAEFRFLQGLDPTRPVHVEASEDRAVTTGTEPLEDRAVVLNGGGKDTAVLAELLLRGGQPIAWVTVQPNATRRAIVAAAATSWGRAASYEIDYEPDPAIARDERYAWGHVPQVAIFLAVGTLVALLTRARYVVAGNERSANVGNIRYRGAELNHQYTKSFAYELAFRDFVRRRISSDLQVLSPLRPFHDLQLAEMFADLRSYHTHFVSCNRGIQDGKWCLRCEKCAFTALALAPFVTPDDLRAVFRSDVLALPEIRQHFITLVGGASKPWECVGTPEECALALKLVLERYPQLNFAQPPTRADLTAVLQGFTAQPSVARRLAELLDESNDQHLIDESLRARLNRALGSLRRRPLEVPPSSLLRGHD